MGGNAAMGEITHAALDRANVVPPHRPRRKSKGYGSKAREWQMDVVILMERVELPGADLAFSIKFTKAREKSPENRDDFEPVTMSLQNDEWTFTRTPTPKKPLSPTFLAMFNILQAAGPAGLTTAEWNEKCRKVDIGTSRRADLVNGKADLKNRKMIHEYADRWFVT